MISMRTFVSGASELKYFIQTSVTMLSCVAHFVTAIHRLQPLWHVGSTYTVEVRSQYCLTEHSSIITTYFMPTHATTTHTQLMTAVHTSSAG